jgi:hypothetical protein
MRTLITVTLFLGSLAVPRLAGAAATKPVERDTTEREPEDTVNVGVLGGIGFPHPLAIEAVVGFKKTVMLGAEYGFMPTTTISSVDMRLWSAAADLRVFPFKGAFFIGLRGGYQSISAETTLSAANVGSYTESVDVGTWFVNPRIGFLWVWKPIALGIDVGVQVPISTTVSRSSLLAVAAPSVDATITSATNTLGRTVLPTVDLLRLGVVF